MTTVSRATDDRMDAMLLPHRSRSLLLRTAALALGLGLVTGCGSDDTDPVASDPQPTSTEATTEPEPGEPSEPSEPAPTEGADTVAAPIYFVGGSPTGSRLYREFRQVESDNPLEEGAALLVAGDALDPDYSTLLPDLDIVSIETTDGARAKPMFVYESFPRRRSRPASLGSTWRTSKREPLRLAARR